MSPTELILRDPLGERALSAADFPVSVGGPGPTIVLPGAGATDMFEAVNDTAEKQDLVTNLHALKRELEARLIRENRLELAQQA